MKTIDYGFWFWFIGNLLAAVLLAWAQSWMCVINGAAVLYIVWVEIQFRPGQSPTATPGGRTE